MRSWPWPWLLASAILAVFLATGVRHLDTVPQVYEDEPWQASAGYKLATQASSALTSSPAFSTWTSATTGSCLCTRSCWRRPSSCQDWAWPRRVWKRSCSRRSR